MDGPRRLHRNCRFPRMQLVSALLSVNQRCYHYLQSIANLDPFECDPCRRLPFTFWLKYQGHDMNG